MFFTNVTGEKIMLPTKHLMLTIREVFGLFMEERMEAEKSKCLSFLLFAAISRFFLITHNICIVKFSETCSLTHFGANRPKNGH